MQWRRTFLPTSSGVQWAYPFSEKWGCGYNLHRSRNAGTIPSWVPDLAPPARHLGQPLLTQASDPQHWAVKTAHPAWGMSS